MYICGSVLRLWYPHCVRLSRYYSLCVGRNGHDHFLTSVTFSPDGQRIVSRSKGRTIRIWDATSGTETFGPLRVHKSCVTGVHFMSDGVRIISSSTDNTIRVWDTSTGILLSKTEQTRYDKCQEISPYSWIYSSSTNTFISKLPRPSRLFPVFASASSRESIVIGFENGQLLIIHIPTKDIAPNT